MVGEETPELRGAPECPPTPFLGPTRHCSQTKGPASLHPSFWCGFSLGCCAEEAVAHCPGIKPVSPVRQDLQCSLLPSKLNYSSCSECPWDPNI